MDKGIEFSGDKFIGIEVKGMCSSASRAERRELQRQITVSAQVRHLDKHKEGGNFGIYGFWGYFNNFIN
jgi:hypothetical protein